MVKADPDYYAALEVAPDATVDEIKKQYRKLALKSHPDRNPGHEAEASARFQAIGAAHEVLTDPEQRRKYDLTRKLPNGSAQRAAPPRNPNPFGPGMQEFAPPPRRGDPRYTTPSRPSGPPPPPRPGAGPHTANAGAARYKNFNPPPPSHPPTSSAQDAKAHADRLHEAWRASRGGPAPAPTRKKYNVPPPPSGFGRPGAATPEDMGRPPPPSDRPYSAYQQQQQQQQQRPPSSRQGSGRAGFDPISPEADEPSAPNAAYRPFGRANPPRMSPTDPPGVPNLPPRASAPRRPSYTSSSRRPSTADEQLAPSDAQPHHGPSRSRSGDQIPYSEANRERTPYTNNNKGEKTYFDSDALRRTASMRDAARVAAAAQEAQDERYRSASQTRSPSYKTYPQYSDDDESNTSTSPGTQSRRGSKEGPGLDDSRPSQSTGAPFSQNATPNADMQDRVNGQHSSAEAMDIDEPSPGSKADGNMNLNDLRNVHPFVPDSSNAMNMGDLKDNLPFQSKASPTHPLKSPDAADSPTDRPSPLDFLNPPKPPVPPQNFSPETWAAYLQKMTYYFTAWNTFNAKVIAHFQDRAIQNQDRERGLGMVDGWLGAVGETETLGGWDSYVRCVTEDERVRMRWNVACERHLEVVDRHSRVRQRVMQQGLLS